MGKFNKSTGKMVLAGLASVLATLSLSVPAHASTPIYSSSEGIGIEVFKPSSVVTRASDLTEGDKVSISGGQLWASWSSSDVTFRANYYHSSKTHRCSATNDHLTTARSEWVSAGLTAHSRWLAQTITNNKVWAATKD